MLKAVMKGEAVRLPNTWEDRPAHRWSTLVHVSQGCGFNWVIGPPPNFSLSFPRPLPTFLVFNFLIIFSIQYHTNRYPYYDHTGLGYGPLYGYGGPELWEYKIWDELEGIH